jgi:hypothetical protein
LDKEGDLDLEGEVEDGSPDSEDCHIIPNSQVATAFVLATVRDDERFVVEGSEHSSSLHAASTTSPPTPLS